jgi:hypothetical protein
MLTAIDRSVSEWGRLAPTSDMPHLKARTEVQRVQMPAKKANGRVSSRANQTGALRPSGSVLGKTGEWHYTAEHNEPAGRPIPDGPEFQLFTFKPTGSGNAPLSFAYRRPWEASQPPARTYNVKVTVSTR